MNVPSEPLTKTQGDFSIWVLPHESLFSLDDAYAKV